MPDTGRLPFLLPYSGLLTFFGFALALLLLAQLLRSNRTPSSTIAWLLVIVLIPYVGVPLYLTFGGRKMRQMAGRKAMVYAPEDATREGEYGGGAERVLRSFGVPPATRGNAVRLLGSGEAAFQELVRLIDGAERSIHVTTYILGRDEVGEEVVARLARRASEGLDVRVLLDDLGSWRTGRSFLSPLVEAGGRVARFMPVIHWPFRGRSNLRNHRKLVVADGRLALCGGMNLASDYMGPRPNPARWRDLALVVEGPAAGDLEALFRSDWAFATGEPADEPPHAGDGGDPPEAEGGVAAQVVASGPDTAGDPLYESLLTLLFNAKERVWVVTPYFVPDELLVHALDLAARRGIDVRLLVPNRSNHASADLARFGYLREVHEAGAKVLRYLPGMVHAKAVLIDDALAVVGSANMDMRSLFLNYEVALFLYDPEQVRSLDAWFGSMFPDCRKGLNRQTWLRGLAENVVRLVSPLL